jgi:hypothetical protein
MWTIDEVVYYSLNFKRFIFFQNSNGSNVRYLDIEEGVVKIFDSDIKYYLFRNNILESELYILSVDGSLFEFDVSLTKIRGYNVGSYKLIFPDRKFLRIFGKSISIHFLETALEEWRIDYHDLVENVDCKIYGRIIKVGTKLFFYLSNLNEENVTFCVDYSTGEVIGRFENFAGNLYSAGNKLYVSAYTFVKILDTATNQITVIDLTSELQPLNLQIHWEKSVYTEDGFMYFVDGHFFTTNRFGIVDLNMKKLIWHGELEISDGVNNNIQEIRIENERVYVHCSDNTLHVFETLRR